MTLDGVAGECDSDARSCLYRCGDDAPFAFARGREFIRCADQSRWALLSDDRLLSMRSGTCLTHRTGNVFYDARSNEPLYYVGA